MVRKGIGSAQDSGINLEEEQNALLGSRKGPVETAPPPRPLPIIPEETFLNLSPLQMKVFLADALKILG